MLQTQTVEPGTYALLKELMSLPVLQDFALEGGTALSLYYGHRHSIDLHLFSNKAFDNEEVNYELNIYFGERIKTRTSTKVGIFAFIDNIKVDIVRIPHPIIRPIRTIQGIRFYTPEDIVAMKVQAILNRAQKKDFYNVEELLKHFSVLDFINRHKEKYNTQNLYITVPQALIYFDNAEDSDSPKGLMGQSWRSVKNNIQAKVRDYLKY